MKVEWYDVNVNGYHWNLPEILRNSNGGWFWIKLDKAFGFTKVPAFWSGFKFENYNKENITHVAKLDIPE